MTEQINYQLVPLQNVINTITTDPTNPYNKQINSYLTHNCLFFQTNNIISGQKYHDVHNNYINPFLLIGIQADPANTFIAEIFEYKNIWSCVYYSQLSHTNTIIQFFAQYLQHSPFSNLSNTTPYHLSNTLAKYIDYKLIFYLPYDSDITNTYKSGPTPVSLTHLPLPAQHQWHQYLVKINQYIAHSQHPERHAKKNHATQMK